MTEEQEMGSSQGAVVASPPTSEIPPAWQPIATAPTWTHVLLWFPRGEHVIALIGAKPESYECIGYLNHADEEPTHWMPLPAAPGEAA